MVLIHHVVVLKYSTMELGALSVMTTGIYVMQKWSADSSVLLELSVLNHLHTLVKEMVRQTGKKPHSFLDFHSILSPKSMQDPSTWTMYFVLGQRVHCLTAAIMDSTIITVDIMKMLVLSAQVSLLTIF